MVTPLMIGELDITSSHSYEQLHIGSFLPPGKEQ